MRSGVPRVLLGHHKVEATRPGLVERRAGLHLHDLDAQRRVSLAERAERLGHEREHRGLERRDPHGARDLIPCTVKCGLRALEPGEQGLGFGGERGARGRELERSAILAQQLDARLSFEERELLGDRRRAVVQGLGDGRDRAARAQFPEQAQPLHIEHRRSFPFASRSFSFSS